MTTDHEVPMTGRHYPPVLPYDEPLPGDPDGDWEARSTELARGMRMEWEPGWEFKRMTALVGEPFDPDQAPPGDGWALNEYCGDRGHAVVEVNGGRQMQVSYWYRRVR